MSRSSKIILGCMVVLLLLMISTQPWRLPAALLILPFVLIFAGLLVGFAMVFRWQGVSGAKRVRFALIGASLPTLVLVLQSFGQLTLRDLLTILALFAIAHFYLSRITGPASE